MKGYVPTPTVLVDRMVSSLFAGNAPQPSDYLLDPGCGDGQFIDGVLRWCRARNLTPPRIIGVELNPSLVAKARRRFGSEASVKIINADYLVRPLGISFHYAIGNPPYVSLANIKESQRHRYRARYVAAHGRFDLYMLFFEQAIKDMGDGGRLAFVTPEKFLYVDAATPLRKMMTENRVTSIELEPEDTFCDRTTYPAITVIQKERVEQVTRTRLRNGLERPVRLPKDGSPWWPTIVGHETTDTDSPVLGDCCLRISAGIATGADSIFVRPTDLLRGSLRRYAYPALAGRDMPIDQDALPAPSRSILVPYDEQGKLLPALRLGALGHYLGGSDNKVRLNKRTCAKRKPWYAFHDNFPLLDIRRPKILCKDISEKPKFWIDRSGTIVPLHSVYYIVPIRGEDLEPLCEWLNGPTAAAWLENHCQRAANGFLRLQSRVLREIPVPANLVRQRRESVANANAI